MLRSHTLYYPTCMCMSTMMMGTYISHDACWLTTQFTKGTKMLQQKCSATWVAHMTLANAAEEAAAAAEIHEL